MPAAQYIGIALACFSKLNDLDGNGFPNAIVTVASPQSKAGHFEGDANDPPSLRIELIGKWLICMARSNLRRERDRSLSHRRLAQCRSR
jgi:hypothetical protein